VTLGAVALYFIGGRVPLPGVDVQAAGGEATRLLSLFGLGVRPIVTALVAMEIARLAFPALARWSANGPRRAQLWLRIARGVALGVATLQALGVAAALDARGVAVDGGGWPFRLEIVVALVGATALLIWLADLINAKGVGDGLVLLFAAPLAAHLPIRVANWWRFGAFLPGYVPTLLLALTVLAVAALVAVSRRGSRRGPLDLWPVLLAAAIFQAFGGLIMWPWNAFVAFVNHLFGDDLGLRSAMALEMGGVVVQILAAAGLFAIVAFRRASVDQTRIEAATWLLLLVEFVVWSGSWIIAELAPAVAANDLGFSIILCVAAALSVLPPWRGGRALASG
jgi:preprotein translocase subunit SecY